MIEARAVLFKECALMTDLFPTLTPDDFEAEVLESKLPVLVEFSEDG